MDELLRTARENLEPPWDEVREARVLGRVLAAVEEDEEASSWKTAYGRPRTWMIGGGLAAAAAALLVFGGAWMSAGSPAVEADGQNASVAAGEVPSTSELTFAPGTTAMLEPGAQVSTIEHSVERVELRQSSGRVAYRVNPDRNQVFEVRAEHVLIHVVGTRFVVDVSEDFVSVQVSKGEVSVVDGPRTLRLIAGEDLRIALGDEAAPDVEVEAPPEEEVVKGSERAAAVGPTVDELMRRADAARQAGDWAAAADALRKVAYERTSDSRSVSALFSLGRVLRAQGNPTSAADVFAQVRRRVGGGAMAEDALAEEAVSRAQAGQGARAASLAAEYEKRYPKGPHLARLRRLR